MKILLLLNQPYPNGYALTKRIHLYAKGIIKNGHIAKIIIPIPKEKTGKSRNILSKGVHDGIPYEYSWKKCERSEYFIERRIHDLYGYLNTGRKIIIEKPNVIITSSFPFLFYCYLKLISIFIPFRLVKEQCEVNYLRKDSINSLDKYKLKIIYSLFNGVIVISRQLKNFINEDLEINIPCILIPILLEENKSKNKFPINKTIVYTGTFLERKDGILTIIRAFADFKVEFPEYKLILTGSPTNSPDYSLIEDLVNHERLKDNIVFTGYLSESKLQEVVHSAELLILAKPSNRQNYYNFPTKIAEYLLSGRPILTTPVGVIGEIFSDNENMFFSEYSTEQISKKIKFIILNKQLAIKVGENGKSFGIKNFNYIYNSDRMINFLKKIV